MRRIILFAVLLSFQIFSDPLIKTATKITLTGKPIMYIFDSATCPYCEKLEKELVELKSLNEIAEAFDIYRIPRDDFKIYDILGKKVSTQELQMSYHVKATPNVVIFDKHAKRMFQTSGYIGPKALEQMLRFVKGVDEGKYKVSEWSKFLYQQNITTSEKSKPKSLQH